MTSGLSLEPAHLPVTRIVPTLTPVGVTGAAANAVANVVALVLGTRHAATCGHWPAVWHLSGPLSSG